jgi:DNA-binding MarR family transcriptional regulator
MPSSSDRPQSVPPAVDGAQSPRRLSLLLSLVAANQRMTRLVERELAADGVDHAHYGTLSMLGAFGPLRLTEVARELGVPLTTASDVVRRLEGQGLVRRRQNPEDGRSFLFELSARGDREWRRGWGALQRINEWLLAEIDEEDTRRVLTQLGEAFALALDES